MMVEMTPEEAAVLKPLLVQLREAGYPQTFTVPAETVRVYQDYLERAEAYAVRLWEAEANPDDPRPFFRWCGHQHFGPMLKNVELIAERR